MLEVAARRAVEAWVEAIDGADDALEALADQAAIDALLYGGDALAHARASSCAAREVARVAIAALDPRAEPATMTVAVTLRGRLYVEDRDTADVVAAARMPTADVPAWTFALASDDAAELPWRLVAVA